MGISSLHNFCFQVWKANGACRFLKGRSKAQANLREAVLAQPVDLEQLSRLIAWASSLLGVPNLGEERHRILPFSQGQVQSTGQFQGCCPGSASGCRGARQAWEAKQGVPLLHLTLSCA